MEANPSQLIEFFNGDKQAVIPLFQRPYEWDCRNWEVLWRDVLDRHESTKDASHFTGAIVTMPAKSVPVGVSKWTIIDGQQRLTTFAILLAAVRDELPPGAIERTRISRFLLNETYDGWDYLKLLPTQDDRGAFKALCTGTEAPAGSRFRAAYEYFQNQIRGGNSDGEPIDPKALLETLRTRFVVVNINLGESDDPYLIFESLNYKGTPLSQADLVRNYLLMRLPVDRQSVAFDSQWKPMQDRLGDSLTEFLRQYLMRTGDEVSRAEVYATLKDRLHGKDVEIEMGEMNRFSVYFLAFIAPAHETHSLTSRGLARLDRWELTTAHPLMLRIFDARANGLMTVDDVQKCLRIIESFVVRRYVCEVPTNQMKRIFLERAKTFPASDIATWLEGALSKGTKGGRWPANDEFNQQWVVFRAYNRIDRCKLILEEIEASYGHKEPVYVGASTIEHIMPQTLSAVWQGVCGPDLHQQWLDTIGNLTLTGYNPELSNDGFEEKKKLLAESHFELNKYFGGVEQWNPAQIESRAKALLTKARDIWPRPVEPGGV